MIDAIPDHLEDIINQTAARVARCHRYLVTRDDLAQEIRLWLLTHEERAANWMDKDNLQEPLAVFRTIAYRRCQDHVASERAAKSGGSASDHYLYTLGMLEESLPMLWDRSARPVNEVSEEPKTRKAKGGHDSDWPAIIVDVEKAYHSLDEADQELLEARFRPPGRQLADLASDYQLSVPTMSRRISQVLGRMADHLGGVNPWR